jgi:hypothetical protein
MGLTRDLEKSKISKCMKFVNFNIAKKLDKLGFDEACFCFYYANSTFGIDDHREELIPYSSNFRGGKWKDLMCKKQPLYQIYNAPTLAQATEWISRKFNIHIAIIPFPSFASENKFAYTFQYKYESDGSSCKMKESPQSFISRDECEEYAIWSVLDHITEEK